MPRRCKMAVQVLPTLLRMVFGTYRNGSGGRASGQSKYRGRRVLSSSGPLCGPRSQGRCGPGLPGREPTLTCHAIGLYSDVYAILLLRNLWV